MVHCLEIYIYFVANDLLRLNNILNTFLSSDIILY